MKRRLFALFVACAVAIGTMPLTGCSSQVVLNDVEKFTPVITNVLVMACEFTNSPICATGGTLLKGDEQLVFMLWQDYITALGKNAATVSMWSQLNTALDTLINDSGSVFALLNIANVHSQTEVVNAAELAQQLLAVIESFVPASPETIPAAAKGKRFHYSRAAKLSTKLPPANPRSGKYDKGWFKSWEKQWNALPAVAKRNMKLK